MFTKRRGVGEFRLPRVGAALLGLALICASPNAARSEDPPAATRPVREIRVRLACDEEWRAQDGWEALARSRLAEASAVFEKRFAIQWRAVDVVPWRSDDEAASMGSLLVQLGRDVPRTGVDVVVGLSRQVRARGADRDYRRLGQARYFGPAAVVRSLDHEPRPRLNLGTLVHELGHLLGAWHCASMDSVMWPDGDRRSSDKFDAQSAAVIELCRDIDFSRGVDWLDEPRRRRTAEIYREGHNADSPVNYVDVEMERALDSLKKSHDVAAARAAYRSALAEQRACVAADDPSLVPCMHMLAWADIQGPNLELDEAERLARLAVALVVTSGLTEDPPLQSEAVLADVAWERGRFVEATASYRKVYEIRLDARGASDPETVDIKSVLDRRGGLPLPPKTWTEVECSLDSPSAGGRQSTIEPPKAGATCVQPLPAVPLRDASIYADSGWTQFAVTVPEAGELVIALRETGAQSRKGTSHTVKAHVGEAAAAGEIKVWMTFTTRGPESTSDTARYSCILAIAVPGTETPTNSGWFPCDVPWKAAVRRTHVLDGGTARLPCARTGSTTLLRAWEWIGDPGQAVVGAGRDITVGGVHVPPDGSAAKCMWHFELTFVPDAAK